MYHLEQYKANQKSHASDSFLVLCDIHWLSVMDGFPKFHLILPCPISSQSLAINWIVLGISWRTYFPTFNPWIIIYGIASSRKQPYHPVNNGKSRNTQWNHVVSGQTCSSGLQNVSAYLANHDVTGQHLHPISCLVCTSTNISKVEKSWASSKNRLTELL